MQNTPVQQYYQRYARQFDLRVLPFAAIRARAIAQLRLTPAACVLEAGCGTGTSFAAIRRAIGDQGQLIGLDASAAMLYYAQRKIVTANWHNVMLIHADAARLPLVVRNVAAVLVFYSNDIITSQEAINQLLGVLQPGGRIVLAGARLTQGRLRAVLNPLTRTYARGGMTSQLTTHPWHWLESRVGSLHVETFFGGSAFLAVGVQPPA